MRGSGSSSSDAGHNYTANTGSRTRRHIHRLKSRGTRVRCHIDTEIWNMMNSVTSPNSKHAATCQPTSGPVREDHDTPHNLPCPCATGWARRAEMDVYGRRPDSRRIDGDEDRSADGVPDARSRLQLEWVRRGLTRTQTFKVGTLALSNSRCGVQPLSVNQFRATSHDLGLAMSSEPSWRRRPQTSAAAAASGSRSSQLVLHCLLMPSTEY